MEMVSDLNLSMECFKNCLVYGSAYTGKTTLIKVYIEFAKKKDEYQGKSFTVFSHFP